ncbi:unnamed protein product, partial [Adineta steineri]
KDCLDIGKPLALTVIEHKAEVIAVSKSDEYLKQLVAQNTNIIPICADLCIWKPNKKIVRDLIKCKISGAIVNVSTQAAAALKDRRVYSA